MNPLPLELQTTHYPEVVPFYDDDTNTFSYVVYQRGDSRCAVIDSVLDLDYPSGTVTTVGVQRIIDYIEKHQLELEWIVETHVHADHLSAAPVLQERLGGKLVIGKNIQVVQETFGKVFNEGTEFKRDGSQFDVLVEDGEELTMGDLRIKALHTPGHTPACMTYIIGDAVFVGDTLFMPDGGTARVDFPGGDARTLYRSIKRVLSLPENFRLFMCHDYCPNGRALEYQTTVAAEKKSNIHVNDKISEDEFVAMREARDATLGMPRLILPSLQVNMRAGHMPPADSDGRVFLKLPVNAFV
jgi:glyoxylase-like metal-dependent hydrolase (beta-lactamase superfamily II)